MSGFTEEFATAYARDAVPSMLKAIASIKRYNKFVLIGALAASYLHQAHYLWILGAAYFACIVPLIFDAAMVSMLTVVRTTGIARDAKKTALGVFIATALLSATINFASPGPLGLRVVFALVVALVIGVEVVAGRIRPDFAAIDAQASELIAAANNLKTRATDATIPAVDASAQLVDEHPTPAGPAVTPVQHATPVEPPAHLLTVARFAVVNHEQLTGRPITPDELATRMSITPAVAGQLIASITGHPAPTLINGATVTFARGAR